MDGSVDYDYGQTELATSFAKCRLDNRPKLINKKDEIKFIIQDDPNDPTHDILYQRS
jgi:hypothetical protein